MKDNLLKIFLWYRIDNSKNNCYVIFDDSSITWKTFTSPFLRSTVVIDCFEDTCIFHLASY